MAMAIIAAGLSFYVPVSVVFLSSRGQSLEDIFIFESILLASILMAEVPSGLISDRIDRRWVILSGFVLNGCAELVFALSTSFGAFALSFVLSGLGIAMLSGTQDAYIYEALGDNADRDSVAVWGHLGALELVAGVCASFVGGVLAKIDVALPALAAAIAACLAAVAILFLPPQSSSAPEKIADETTFVSLKRGICLLVSSPILLYTAVASAAVFVLFNSVFTLNQPIFDRVDVPIAFWGFIVGGAQLAAAVYDHFSGVIVERVGRRVGLLLAFAYGVVGFILMTIPHTICVISGFTLVIVSMFARGPITRAVANKEIPSERRATVLNVASTLGSLIGILINPIIGWGADRSPVVTVVGIAIVLFIVMLTWIPIANRYVQVEETEEEQR
ncbi:MFS transporter [Actinotignum sanguinis]|uniref:MFS transporter n=1 Tax=Actinotignum sanguinis TaxID=1445614 RepID=UPI002A7F6ACF|nr:MFS transporter [Actinotignum sanguinis]MDY5135956.1 MFS transporter [Actinotignum sanguinis]